MPLEIRKVREGATFRVRAHPGARRDAVRGEHGGAIKVDVKAPPEKGKANERLVEFLAGALGLDRKALEVLRGEASKDKTLLARGVDEAALSVRLAALLVEADERKAQADR